MKYYPVKEWPGLLIINNSCCHFSTKLTTSPKSSTGTGDSCRHLGSHQHEHPCPLSHTACLSSYSHASVSHTIRVPVLQSTPSSRSQWRSLGHRLGFDGRIKISSALSRNKWRECGSRNSPFRVRKHRATYKARTLSKNCQHGHPGTLLRITTLVIQQPGHIQTERRENATSRQPYTKIPHPGLGFILHSCHNQVPDHSHRRRKRDH